MPLSTVKDRRPCSSTFRAGCVEDDEPDAVGKPGRGLRITTNERPVSSAGADAPPLDATSLSLSLRFLRMLYQCFFFGCEVDVAAGTFSGGCSVPPLPLAPGSAAKYGKTGAFSTTAV